MMKLTWADLNQRNFLEALKKLREGSEKLPINSKYRVAVIAQACYLEMIEAQKMAKTLLEKYAKKDEKGEVIGFPDPSKIEFANKEQENRHDMSFKAALTTKFKVACNPIDVAELADAGLTTEELLALRPVLKDVL